MTFQKMINKLGITQKHICLNTKIRPPIVSVVVKHEDERNKINEFLKDECIENGIPKKNTMIKTIQALKITQKDVSIKTKTTRPIVNIVVKYENERSKINGFLKNLIKRNES